MRLARVEYEGEWVAAIEDKEARLLRPWSDWTLVAASAKAEVSVARRVQLADVRLLPPVSPTAKIICLGLNYRDHAEEAGGAPAQNPGLFTKFADALVGPGDALVRPRVSAAFDYEGEIAVVIGRGGRHITRADALSHVFGYAIMLDGSVRDFQGHSVSAGKNFWRSGALGPWVVTAEEIPDPAALTLETRLNGAVVQSTRADLMIHDIPSAIAYISQWTPLAPGDVIATGTPAGVGVSRKPPLWMVPGDRVEVEVNAIGVLANPVAAEDETR